MVIYRKIIELKDETTAENTMRTIAKGFNACRLDGKTVEIWCCDNPKMRADERKDNANLGSLVSSIAPVKILSSHINSPSIIGHIKFSDDDIDKG